MASGNEQRWIRIVHALPGRVRLRLPWLHAEVEQATLLADALTKLPGMREVAVRPHTGSVLCVYEARDLHHEMIVDRVREHTGVDRIVAPDEPDPEVAPVRMQSTLAVATARFFHEVNVDVLRATQGRLDLGTLATAGFVGAGALDVAITGKLPMPPWFNLAYWAFTTFTVTEQDVISQEGNDVRQAKREEGGEGHGGNGDARA